DLRRALDDDAKTPRFIETARGRGYRFLAPVSDRPPAAVEAGAPAGGALFGRDAESDRLRAGLRRALSGTRQALFIRGEPGIGKTALVEAFLRNASERPGLDVARGECLAGRVAKEP